MAKSRSPAKRLADPDEIIHQPPHLKIMSALTVLPAA